MTASGLPIQALEREERLSDRVAKRLEDLILEDELKTGQKLPPEREIAKLFNVSRTVVREAIHTLAAKHLVEVRSGSGTFVSGPSAKSVAESLGLLIRSMDESILVDGLHEVRRVLEIAVASRAAERAAAEDITDIQDILRRMEDSAGDDEAIATLDVEFHRALAIATHNPLFIILLDSIAEPLLTIRRLALEDPDTYGKSLAHHRGILDMVMSRDPQGAGEAMAAHLDQSQDTMSGVFRARGRL